MSSDPTSPIYALNVNLFAFSLQSGVDADDKKTINVSPEIFKQKYEQLIQNYASTFGSLESLPKLRKEVPKSHQYDLLEIGNKQGRQFYSFSSQAQNPLAPKRLYRLTLYPQKISDSYALLINVFRPQSAGFDAVSLDEIPTFNPNQCLSWRNDENLIGETYLITAFLSEAKPSYPEALKLPAEEILKKLFNGYCPDFYQADKFLDSYILDFGSPKRSQTRYLVLFYFAASTCDRFKKIYWDLPELFLYYHKVTHFFQMSRQNVKQLDIISEKIESQLPSFDNNTTPSENLDLEDLKTKLKKLLETAPQHTWKLRQLENALNTIEINTGNYQRTLKRLQNQVGDRLDLFDQFARRESKTLQLQIQADLNYAKPGSQLLDQAIASIRGIVEIEQVESDRSLEKTIQILAAGLGAGGIVASAVSGHIDKPLVIKTPQTGAPIHPGVSSLLCSFFAALIFGGVVGLINGKFRLHGTITKIFNYILGHSK